MYNVSVVRYRYGLLLNLRYKKTDKVKEMKKNVNVFIAVLLVAVLCGGVIWLQTADEEKLGWNIHDSYGDTPSYSGGAAYTNATFAGPSAGEGGVMPLSSSSALRARTSYSYAGAYAISYGVSPASSPNSLIASSPLSSAPSGAGLYTTSSKTFNSYGGGGNGGAAMGGAMRGSSSPNSLIASLPITSISPIAYSTARRSDMTATGENLAMMAAENPVMAMTNAAQMSSPYEDVMVAGFYNAYINGTYGNMGGQSNVRGRQNSSTLEDAWDNWLADWLAENGYDSADVDRDGDVDWDDVHAIYAALQNSSNTGMGMLPTEQDIYDWLVPVGDILPLLLIALLYIVAMYMRTKSRTQVND